MYQNQNHTGCKNNNLVSATASNDVKSYLQFCTMFGLTQIVKSPTRITFSSTSLIDHILASLPDRISQEGVMNVGLSDHQLIYCIRKISRVKTRGVHKIIRFCSRKNYAVDAYKNALKKINFPNYEYFEDVNRAYSDFFQKLMTVIDNVAPCKTKSQRKYSMERHLENLGQGTNSLKRSRKRGFISINSCIKRLNMTHKS